MGKNAYSIRRCGRRILHKKAMGGMSTNINHLNLYTGTLFPHIFFICLEMLDEIQWCLVCQRKTTTTTSH
jgi:hypothetical protein